MCGCGDPVTAFSPALDGALEFLFVLDSKDDPAFHTASMLASRPNSNSVRVLIATASRTNSQKIHNIQTGIKVRDRQPLD